MNGQKILIVEDEGMIRRALADRLGEEDLEVLSAADGKEGLETARAEKPDLVLLDVIMPEMDGISVSDELSASPETANIPVIFLTNLSDSADVRKKIQRDQYDFLVKANWDIEDVVNKVNTKLG